jgi:hypothetical protein
MKKFFALFLIAMMLMAVMGFKTKAQSKTQLVDLDLNVVAELLGLSLLDVRLLLSVLGEQGLIDLALDLGVDLSR